MADSLPLSGLLEGKCLLIFDFDGTLADTSPLHEQAFARVLSPHGVTVDYAAIAGMKTRDAIEKCLSSVGLALPLAELNSLVTAKQSHVRVLIKQHLQPIRRVDEFLRWARLRYRLAMYSSGSRETVSLALDKLGYLGWFDPMICAEDVNHAKPDPEGYLKVLALTGVSEKEALVFEDSVSGMLSARTAGLEAVLVSCEYEYDRLTINECNR